MIPEHVVAFWREHEASWFGGGAEFDALCRARFHDAHFAAARREHEDWLATADGALALQILLDQIPRNVFRGTAHAFATDSLARHYAERTVEAGLDAQVDRALRVFVYLPFEHSEDLADQERAVALIHTLDHDLYLRYAEAHRDVIARFGRFPHRNVVLGRVSTEEERAWLDAGGGF